MAANTYPGVWLSCLRRGTMCPTRPSARMTLRIMIEDDPDVAFQRVVAAGATVVWSVNNQPFGWCVGRIVDPFGHHWQIGKPLARSP